MHPTKLTLLALAALALSACGKKADAPPPAPVSASPETPLAPPPSAAPMAPAAPGDAKPAEAANTPAWGVLYPGAQVKTSDIQASPQGPTGQVVFETKDDAKAVVAFYKAKAAAAGLETSMEGDMNGSQMFNAEAAGHRGVEITATPAHGATQVQLVWVGPKA